MGSNVDSMYGVFGTCGIYTIGGGAYVVPYPIVTLKRSQRNAPPPATSSTPSPPPAMLIPISPPTSRALTRFVWSYDIFELFPFSFFGFFAFLAFLSGRVALYQNANIFFSCVSAHAKRNE